MDSKQTEEAKKKQLAEFEEYKKTHPDVVKDPVKEAEQIFSSEADPAHQSAPTTDPFLPNDYNVPSKADGYMKFQQGDNRFRVLCAPVLGWLWWEDVENSRKPRRVHSYEEVPTAEKIKTQDKPKHFWAMVVFNYDARQIQILEITQQGIQKTIKSYSQDEDWGSPLRYDLVVSKTGEKLETEYEVKAKPAKPLEDEISALYKSTNINLDALFTGEDPFSFEKTEVVNEDINENEIPF